MTAGYDGQQIVGMDLHRHRSVLVSMTAGRHTMVVAVPSSGWGWSYLWGGRGTASTADPSDAAEQIAALLGR